MKRVSAVFVALSALLFVGCGSSDSGGEASDTTLSRQEFRTQAETACNRFANDAKQYLKDATPTPSAEQIRNRLKNLGQLAEELTNKLEELEPPEQDRDAYDKALELQTAQVEAIRKAEEAFANGDEDEGKRIVKDDVEGTGPDVNEQFDSIGLERCGSEAGS